MKLAELKIKKATGTYVALRPSASTKALLEEYATEYGLQLDEDLHVTVLYSRVVLPVLVNTDEHITLPTGFTKLGTALVLELDAPSIVARHNQLINQGHTHDFEDHIVHMTIMKEPGSLRPGDLPPVNFGLNFGLEYTEAL